MKWKTKIKKWKKHGNHWKKKQNSLQLTSKYKSEFLANMSHELRTPLNSLFILAQQLYENAEGNLNDKQIVMQKRSTPAVMTLIQLINDILDLSKIESGFITANISPVRLLRDRIFC